jgi:hypothetical protein
VPKPTLKVREGAEVSGATGIRGGGRGSSKGKGGAIGGGRGHIGAATKVPLPINTNTTLDVGSQGPEPSHSGGLSGGGTRSTPTNPSSVKRSSAKELASDVRTRLQSQSEAAIFLLCSFTSLPLLWMLLNPGGNNVDSIVQSVFVRT